MSTARDDGEAEALRHLASQVGILAEYYDLSGTLRPTGDATREALLSAMGYDVSPRRIHETLAAERERMSVAQLMPPVRVLEEESHGLDIAASFQERPSFLAGAPGRWRVVLHEESGETTEREGRWGAPASSPSAFPTPKRPPRGYHSLELFVAIDQRELRFEQTLIVVPGRCYTPALAIGEDRVFGILANLYTLRSERNWGVGDFADLGTLFRWARSVGAQFVGINPLHALLNRGTNISPYSPVSRIFKNPLYLAVDEMMRGRHAPAVETRLASTEMQSMLRALRELPNVDYEQVAAVKGLALDALYAAGGSGHPPLRQFVAAHEPELTLFATWMALHEVLDGRAPNGDHRATSDWRQWPEEFRRPHTGAVRRFQEEHADRIAYHRWLQFEIDRQLSQASGERDGMRIGLYQDLAVGSAPGGADTWAHQELFVHGVSIGAPPDPYSATGQEWGLPPLNPEALQRDRYRYFIAMVRANLRHAGALRIDHVMGLFRQFWIPAGGTAADGAYMRYPAADLFGILSLESTRSRAMIVGEDLGTVPPEVPEAMNKWGLLSSRVMYFLKDGGEYAPPTAYPPNALSTANLHDLPPINGFWNGRDIAIRHEVGVLTDDEAGRRLDEREGEKSAFVRRLQRSKLLPEEAAPSSMAELRGATHAFLCGLESQLVGISLDDLTGEVDPVNVPGVRVDQWPCWTRKMTTDLADLATSPEVATALKCESRR